MDVSVVVPVLNEEKYLGACLRSVVGQDTSVDFEVVVCDGRSTDGTVGVASEFSDKVVFSDVRSVGFQRNLGARNSSGRLLLFVDADTVLPPDYLDSAVSKFKGNPRLLGASGGFRFSERGRRVVFAEKATNAYLVFRDRAGSPTLPGFNTIVRRGAFEAVGGFRDVPLEDIDFSRRLHAVGLTRYFTDFHVVTSARRLEGMGLLGTLRYYLEMDLARVNPELGGLLSYTTYVSCRFDAGALERAFERFCGAPSSVSGLSSSLRGRASARVSVFSDRLKGELRESRAWAFSVRRRLMEQTIAASKAISYVESKRIDAEVLEQALGRVQEKFRAGFGLPQKRSRRR